MKVKLSEQLPEFVEETTSENVPKDTLLQKTNEIHSTTKVSHLVYTIFYTFEENQVYGTTYHTRSMTNRSQIITVTHKCQIFFFYYF